MTDPFAGDPWATDEIAAPWGEFRDEAAVTAVTEEPPAAPQTPTVTTTTPTKERAISSEGKIVTTIKYGDGFDAPWTVIHADTPHEALAILNDPVTRQLLETTAKVAKFVKSLDSGSSPRRASGTAGGGGQQPSTPPGVEAKTCAHGQMVYRTGNSPKGGPWRAWFCPAPKGDPNACKPIWV